MQPSLGRWFKSGSKDFFYIYFFVLDLLLFFVDYVPRSVTFVSPSIAQLVERKTVGAHHLGCAAIFRSLVRIRLEGLFEYLFFFLDFMLLFVDYVPRSITFVSPSIAQLVERKTVGVHHLGCAAIFRSLVQIRLEGFFLYIFFCLGLVAFLCGLCSKKRHICVSFDSSVGRAEDCRSTSSGMCSHL